MLRGLSIRLDYARVNLTQQIVPELLHTLNEDLLDIQMNARHLGFADNMQNKNEVPALFVGVPLLESAWHEGWEFKSELDDIASCPGCINSHGDPCCIHG